MDRNLLLAFALSFAVLALWTSTMEPRRRPTPPAAEDGIVEAQPPSGPGSAEPERTLTADTSGALPSLPPAAEPAPAVQGPAASPIGEPEGVGEIVRVDTQLFDAELTTLGAGLRKWELTRYHEGPRRGGRPLVLTTGRPPLETAFITPFEELGLGNLAFALFDVTQPDPYTVVFALTRKGVTVTKTYHFREDEYAFRLEVEVNNSSDGVVAPRFAVLSPAHVAEGPDFKEQTLVVLHEGDLEKQPLAGFGKPSFFGGAPTMSYEYRGDVDWAGIQTTYFLSALLPGSPSRASAQLVATEPGKQGVAGIFFDPEPVPPGQTALEEFKGYIGPKEETRLLALGGETQRSIDLGYSWLAPMTRGFNWCLRALYSVIPNYGVAIILLTILVRLVTAPLTIKQMRSMERMRALSPKLKEIQAKYADDRQKQSEETMRLYRQEKVNPLGGCFPMILQLPVFIGLFYALRSSIQLRQAGFVGWIDDLSTPEMLFTIPGPIPIPIRVLPLIMGATMVIQQRLTPMPSVDPAQARMMQTVMPIMMTVLFYQFPSGLVLYWMVSNLLAIAHQRWIGRGIQQGS